MMTALSNGSSKSNFKSIVQSTNSWFKKLTEPIKNFHTFDSLPKCYSPKYCCFDVLIMLYAIYFINQTRSTANTGPRSAARFGINFELIVLF